MFGFSERYSRGAVTAFGLNVKDHTEDMYFYEPLESQTVDVYLLTPNGSLTTRLAGPHPFTLSPTPSYLVPPLPLSFTPHT